MPTYVDVEEIQTTKSEKLLAVVLAAFLLVGALWAYQRVDDSLRAAIGPATPAAADRAAVQRLDVAGERLSRAELREREALDEMTVARETYRTALDADDPAPALAARYEEAQASYEEAQAETDAAAAAVTEAEPAARAAGERIAADALRVERLESLAVFGARLLLVLGTLAGSLVLLGRLRRRGSRYLVLGLAAVGSGAVLALVMAGDYVTDYVDPLEFGPLVLAAAGAALTLAAFAALQRYLARRVPARRVRKGECPFCGFPAKGHKHCEGCGQAVLSSCETCTSARRVGAPHCASCGAA